MGEYWIVLPAERRIEVHRTPQPTGYRDCVIVEGDAILECQVIPSICIRLVDLFG